jgi:hypothetical protein
LCGCEEYEILNHSYNIPKIISKESNSKSYHDNNEEYFIIVDRRDIPISNSGKSGDNEIVYIEVDVDGLAVLEVESVQGAVLALFGQEQAQHCVDAGQVVRYYYDYAHLSN